VRGVAHGFGRRRGLADVAEAVDEPALLIHADEDLLPGGVAYLRGEVDDLRGRLDVAPEEDDAAGPHLAQERAPVPVEFRHRQPDEEQPPGLAPDRVLVRAQHVAR
jgi:hypothetical protein